MIRKRGGFTLDELTQLSDPAKVKAKAKKIIEML